PGPLHEMSEGEILVRRDIALEVDEDILPVLPAFSFLLLIKMIGEIGRNGFKPVAFPKVGIHIISEPLMGDLMSQGGLENKGEPDDLLAQESEGGHGKPRRQDVFYDGESFVRIGAKQ